MSQLQLPPYQKQRRSYAGPLGVTNCSSFANVFLQVSAPSMAARNLPEGTVALENQVAGHTFQVGTDEIGMLKLVDEGSVLKPAGAPMCAAREIKFYEQLQSSSDPAWLPLRQFTSEFRGTQTMAVGSRRVQFIKLCDITYGLNEPCVMDIKIGRRTWDPMATEKKREAEESKYQECRATFGFCIPGFQTYHLKDGGACKRFGKEYGKKLKEATLKEAMRLFLNADSGLCRQLLMKILTRLWEIQKWIANQRSFQFYSSSILIVYDARRLKSILETQKSSEKLACDGPLNLSVPNKVQRSISEGNTYEQELERLRKAQSDSVLSNDWVNVKMIDFAHTFVQEDEATALLDVNYLEGIEHLVEIFEDLLKKCE